MNSPSIIVVGAGGRGAGYARYLQKYPEMGTIVGVCEPIPEIQKTMKELYDISDEMVFNSWEELAEKPKLADCIFLCTQDRMHKDPAIAFAKKGYHMLLEKPMAPTAEDCVAIYDEVIKSGIIFAVCHVLRYTSFNKKLKELVDSGLIGKIQTIQLLEPVGFWHQAHSFVRGHWRNSEESSPMLLAKSCHDIDLLNYFAPAKCKKVSSFGSLSHFRKECQPKGAGNRCNECPEAIERNCPYSAYRIYLELKKDSWHSWPTNVLTKTPTEEAVREAIKTGPYGRCVYACDNDVVDHQVVNMEFEDNSTASFTMTAFNEGGSRELLIMGDRGTLKNNGDLIEHYDFLTAKKEIIPIGMLEGGHGGGDSGLITDFLKAVAENNPSYITSGADVSLQSHLMVFAAEKARANNTVEKL